MSSLTHPKLASFHLPVYLNCDSFYNSEPSTTSNQQPKKRRRKDSTKPCSNVVDVSRTQAKMVGGKDQSAAPGSPLKKISNDSKTVHDSVPPLKVQNGNDSLVLENVKHTDKANNQPRKATRPNSKAAGSSGPLRPKCSCKSAHQQSNSLPGKSRAKVSAKSTVVRQQENNGMHDLDIASKKGGSNVRPKSSTLEKAIKELEKVVGESRPPAATENQDADISTHAVKRGLPRDVKLKLSKVARIAQTSQGNVSRELINRLMSIVGHLIQIRSLKRNLKIMIDSENREKDSRFQQIKNEVEDSRFQQIKNEVIEMIKTQLPLMESQPTNQEFGTSDDFQDVGSVGKPPLKKKFVMDAKLEENLCDLYDIFVKGLEEEEDTGPYIRKLYGNLAELWPNKLMDNHEIKRAICREKDRRRALNGNLGIEMDQTKQTQLVQISEVATNPDKALGIGVQESVVLSATTMSLVHSQPAADLSHERSKQQHKKLKGTSSLSNPTAKGKTVRRKTEQGLEESHLPAEKYVVLALRRQTHTQAKTQKQTPPDLNLPS